MANVIGLHHIGVVVSDIERSVSFYTGLLQFTVSRRVDMENGTRLAFLSAGDCTLELIQRQDGDVPAEAGQVDHVCLAVDGIDALYEAVKAGGAKMLTPQVNTLSGGLAGIRNCFFEGPDGEKIELFDLTNADS